MRLEDLTVAQLKERLKAKGKPVSGTKALLIERLRGGGKKTAAKTSGKKTAAKTSGKKTAAKTSGKKTSAKTSGKKTAAKTSGKKTETKVKTSGKKTPAKSAAGPTVAELRTKLKAKGLKTSGVKAELIKRLGGNASGTCSVKKPSGPTAVPGPTKVKSGAKKVPAKGRTMAGAKNPAGVKGLNSARSRSPTKPKSRRLAKMSSSQKSARSQMAGQSYDSLMKPKRMQDCQQFYIHSDVKQDSTKPMFNKVVFQVNEDGNKYHLLTFKTLKTEKQVVQAVQTFLSQPMTNQWFNKYKTGYEQGYDHCYRGDLLQGHNIYQGMDVKGKIGTIRFAS